MISASDAADMARTVYEDANWEKTEDRINRLAEQIVILEGRGLGKLNQRLRQGGREIGDTIVEHNLAAALVLRHTEAVPIEYEPGEGVQRPIDFKIELEGLTYWVQVKNLARLARENKQHKIFEGIGRSAENIRIGKLFCYSLAADFGIQEVPELMKFMTENAECAKEGEELFFPDAETQRAKVMFISPKQGTLSHLTPGSYGDAAVVNVTGLSEEQIRGSLQNAAKAFEWNVRHDVINLIAVQADREIDIHISDAVFGTEEYAVRDRQFFAYRKNDGLFQDDNFSKKVGGIISMRGKEGEPICDCSMLLFINDRFTHLSDRIESLLPLDMIINKDMRASSDDGNFKIA